MAGGTERGGHVLRIGLVLGLRWRRPERGRDEHAPMSSRRLAHRRIGAVAGVALIALLGVDFLAHLIGSGARADTGSGDPQPQPVLGAADASTVLMGAATAGEPGEAWAYDVLPLNVPPPANGNGRARFAAPSGESPPGQLVFERATDADPDWTIYETPLTKRRASLIAA